MLKSFSSYFLLILLIMSCSKKGEIEFSQKPEESGSTLNPQQIAEAQTAAEETAVESVSAIMAELSSINFEFDWQSFLGGGNQAPSDKKSEPQPESESVPEEVSYEVESNDIGTSIQEALQNLEYVSYDKTSQVALFKLKMDCDPKVEACLNFEKFARLGVNLASKSLELYWNQVRFCSLSAQNKSVSLSCSMSSSLTKHFFETTLMIAPEEDLQITGADFAKLSFNKLQLDLTSGGGKIEANLAVDQAGHSDLNADLQNVKLEASLQNGKDLNVLFSADKLAGDISYNDWDKNNALDIPRKVRLELTDILIGGGVKNQVFDELVLKVVGISAKDEMKSSAQFISATIPSLTFKKEGSYLSLNTNGNISATVLPYTELIGLSGNGLINFSANKILFSLDTLLQTGYLKPENDENIQVDVAAGEETLIGMNISAEKPLDGGAFYQMILSALGFGEEQKEEVVQDDKNEDDKENIVSNALPESCQIKLETKIFDQSNNLLLTQTEGPSYQTSSINMPYFTSSTLKIEAQYTNTESCPMESLSTISYKGYYSCGGVDYNSLRFKVVSSSSTSLVLEASNISLPQDCNDKYSFSIVTSGQFDGYSNGTLYMNANLNIDAPNP